MPNYQYHNTEYEKYIFWKGVSNDTLAKIKYSGYITPRKVEKGGIIRFGVYVSRSSKTASKYGGYVLKLDLKGKNVVPTGHSNQWLCLGAIESNRIINVEEMVR